MTESLYHVFMCVRPKRLFSGLYLRSTLSALSRKASHVRTWEKWGHGGLVDIVLTPNHCLKHVSKGPLLLSSDNSVKYYAPVKR